MSPGRAHNYRVRRFPWQYPSSACPATDFRAPDHPTLRGPDPRARPGPGPPRRAQPPAAVSRRIEPARNGHRAAATGLVRTLTTGIGHAPAPPGVGRGVAIGVDRAPALGIARDVPAGFGGGVGAAAQIALVRGVGAAEIAVGGNARLSGEC
jgi:hypothetical protein